MSLSLITVAQAIKVAGVGRAKFYRDVKAGLMTEPVRRGTHWSRWPAHEVEAITRARMAGEDDEAIRALVLRLTTDRQAGATWTA